MRRDEQAKPPPPHLGGDGPQVLLQPDLPGDSLDPRPQLAAMVRFFARWIIRVEWWQPLSVRRRQQFGAPAPRVLNAPRAKENWTSQRREPLMT
jgi:hypothetical protein